VTSVVGSRAFVISLNIAVAVFVNMQQEYLAKARLFSISAVSHALKKCRKALGHSRKMGLPVTFMRMFDESAFFSRAKVANFCDASAGHARDTSTDEIHRAVSRISGLYGEGYETTEWIDRTVPRKLIIG
jgi:hypothetical protein